MTKPPPRHLPLMLVLVAACAALGLGFGERWFSRHGAHVTRAAAEQAGGAPSPPSLSEQALLYPQPRVLAPFSLQAANGATLTNADLRGSWTLVFFGFTHCPDVCPTAMATFKQIEELNGTAAGSSGSEARNGEAPGVGEAEAGSNKATGIVPAGAGSNEAPRIVRAEAGSREAPGASGLEPLRVNYWFISVDPERDTPPVLGEYASYFSPSIVAATAPVPQVEALARDFGVVFFKVPQDTGDYTIDHSMQLLLVDPDGKLHAMWRPPHIPPTMLDDIAMIASARGRR